MNREILEKKLEEKGVKNIYYSLYGELKPDSIVLYQNYKKWEVFYFSERGEKENEKIFFSESEACEYIYNNLIEAKKIAEEHNLNY